MAQTTVHVLGSGTCFPEPGRTRRAHPGFYIKWGDGPDQHLLLECSSGIAERLEAIGVGVDEIRHLAVSHAHPDHFAFPQFFQSAHCALPRPARGAEGSMEAELHLYAPAHIINSIDSLMAIHFEETVMPGERPGLKTPRLEVHKLSDDGWERAWTHLPDNSKLTAYRVRHGFGRVDAIAFRLEIKDGPTIAYSGDTGVCPGIREAARKTDLFICEASARVGDGKTAFHYGHLNPLQAGEIAVSMGVKKLVLTHYSGFDTDETMIDNCRASGFKGDLVIAKDGMQLMLA